jgi:hypothetical protein
MAESMDPVVELAAALGAEPGYSKRSFTVYIPEKDRSGKLVPNQSEWIEEAIRLLCEINGGATAMPPVEGGWMNEEGVIIREHPVVVYSYIRAGEFLAGLPRIREFLHRLGRESDQGEIAFEFEGQFYRIRQYDQGSQETKP